jgi:hypothetical protein
VTVRAAIPAILPVFFTGTVKIIKICRSEVEEVTAWRHYDAPTVLVILSGGSRDPAWQKYS